MSVAIVKPCGAPCSSGDNPCEEDCITSITCRQKAGDNTVGPPDGDGNYNDNSGCQPQGGYNYSGTVTYLLWTVDVVINWTYSGGNWVFSGSVSRGTVPDFILPDDPEIYGNSSKENNLTGGTCSQAPNFAVVFFGNAVFSIVTGTGTGGYAPGPSVGPDPGPAVPAVLDNIVEEGSWSESEDCDMSATNPDAMTGDFSYVLKQPRAHLTGLIVGEYYLLTFHYQKYVAGEWVPIYDLVAEVEAEDEEEDTDYIDTSELHQFLPGQLRLDPECPASLLLEE